jgi:hypothetical protein
VSGLRSLVWAGFCLGWLASPLRSQEIEVERPGPTPLETFETDADGDGVPDGWYNLRDARMVEGGVGPAKSRCLRFENARAGRPSRASRAFGVDGRKVEAIVVSLLVRAENVVPGERLGDDPSLVIDFLGPQLRAVRRGSLGPWKTVGSSWTHVSKRLPIPPDTRDAILSLGLLGATGVLEVDNLAIELVPYGGKATGNLVLNGDFELGDPAPEFWQTDKGARRISPGGHRSDAAIELKGAGARAYAGLSLPVGKFASLVLSVSARGANLRGANGAVGLFFFLDDDGQPIGGDKDGSPVINFTGSFGWQNSKGSIDVPKGASRALVQFEKPSSFGTLVIDDVVVTAPGATDGQWTPYHVETNTTGWKPITPSPSILAGSPLDASSLLDAPAGKHGAVVVRDGRLTFTDGTRARFLGVALLPPVGFPEPNMAEELADRLSRSGVNLVQLSDLDTPLGPQRSLFDDVRDDTKALDPDALARLDHLIATLKKRGIYVALDLQGARRFRDGDDTIAGARQLPPGGGPAAAFDPAVREATRKAAEALLRHVNPETGLALVEEPALAWVTLAGELSLFDLLEADEEYPTAVVALRALLRKDGVSNARRDWQAVESAQWKALADDLRKLGLKVPIAGSSHWKRDYDFAAAQAGPGLDLIDDRLFYTPPSWVAPERRSGLWARDGGVLLAASRKRKPDRPYVVGQWAVQTYKAWATPYEGADFLLAAQVAAIDDWDALVRRGVFLFPRVWGFAAAGTGGGEDIFQLPEVTNGTPQSFALLPHAASMLLRAPVETKPDARKAAARKVARPAGKSALAGWQPVEGRLAIDTRSTKGLAGWVGQGSVNFEGLTIEVGSPFAVVVVSALHDDSMTEARRLLVTAVGKVEPTGFRWVDEWKREPGDPGIPPLIGEPVKAKVTWKRGGTIKAYALDNTGARIGPAEVETSRDGTRLTLDGRSPGLHWELVVE